LSMNTSPLGRRYLKLENMEGYPTGRRMKELYYDRLAALDSIAPHLVTGFTAARVGRQGLLKTDLIGDPRRAEHPFIVYGHHADGTEHTFHAKAVIDATGVYDTPNYLGQGGLPALGELSHREHISYHLRELTDEIATARRFLVVGHGHSACTAILQLDSFSRQHPDVSITWVTSKPDAFPLPVQADDPLPERARVVAEANRCASGENPAIAVMTGYWVSRIDDGTGDSRLRVTLETAEGQQERVDCDYIFAMVGYQPDRSLYQELQVHECWATAAPMKLAAHLLASDASSDCLADTGGSDDLYKNPEPNFFIIGAKSWGRSTNFLLQKGQDEIRAVFRLLTGHPNLDHYGPLARPVVTVADAEAPPADIDLASLDNLWFQVSGTICNLSCRHCFISCSPENDTLKMMSLDDIRPYLEEARTLGVKEFYFTGGEPFINPDMFDILRETLLIGPATVLTNATVITERRARRLAELADNSRYSLEIRVSLDGFDEATNDRFRGEGSFRKAVKGIERLVAAGLLPIVTAVQTWDDAQHYHVVEQFKVMLQQRGYAHPRLKIMPALDMGAYKRNRLGPPVTQLVTTEMMQGYEKSQLLCNNTRMVSNEGVHVCPILVDYPAARMGTTLSDSLRPFTMTHPACYTCYLSGAICSNFSGVTQ
ncbi:MAG: radical SAM protein, partial [Candidatus Zixiibacteriota bacterium]